MVLESRVTIFTGGYGSGKTEVAVNYALHLIKSHDDVAIVDLDIVNPYFRSREAAEVLELAGVEVIAPRGNLKTADLPALPSEIYKVLRSSNTHVVIDVGGDDVGATALARFWKHIPSDSDVLLVVNPARPFQATSEAIIKLAKAIESKSRQKISSLVCNANLLHETSSKFIQEKFLVVQEVASQLKVPIAFTVVTDELIQRQGPPQVTSPLFPIHLQMSPSWRK